jgi:cytochrome P450
LLYLLGYADTTCCRTLFFAGHDTTANTTPWFLYEVAKRRDYQNILREEVKSLKEVALNRGDAELSIADYDSMKYMLAAMKVCSFLHFNEN